ncbi:hypothetical protein OsI_37560 [Oryza sativa Indica Group]|uniref:Uncharacterized protein n=1 Tax=Oryza sativa subsp. indica TaxID=39946 RepID=B8BNA8_ORYSI|nr:hypothetical protein OsI_37560 [Oryza sativa Indica Group]
MNVKDPEESKQETPYACRFFMWEGQYEQFLADGRVGLGHQTEHEKFNVEAISSMGIEGLELKGFAALGRMLVYLAVVQALLLLDHGYRKVCKGLCSVLGTEDVQAVNDEENDGPSTTDDRSEVSSASKSKKAQTQENEDEGLIGAFTSVGDKLVAAILKFVLEPTKKTS